MTTIIQSLRAALLGALLCFFVFPTGGCSSAPSERVVQVQSLKAVGHAAESAVALSAQLYRDGRITAAQARTVLDFYNERFQPVYRVAVSAVNANLDTLASPELLSLAGELSNLVLQLQKHP